jgi:hypothetical protein
MGVLRCGGDLNIHRHRRVALSTGVRGALGIWVDAAPANPKASSSGSRRGEVCSSRRISFMCVARVTMPKQLEHFPAGIAACRFGRAGKQPNALLKADRRRFRGDPTVERFVRLEALGDALTTPRRYRHLAHSPIRLCSKSSLSAPGLRVPPLHRGSPRGEPARSYWRMSQFVGSAVDGSSRANLSTRADEAIGDGQKMTEEVRSTTGKSGQGPAATASLSPAAILW